VKEFFFDGRHLPANLPRAREIAAKLGPLGVQLVLQSARETSNYDTIRIVQGQRACAGPGRLRKAATERSDILHARIKKKA